MCEAAVGSIKAMRTPPGWSCLTHRAGRGPPSSTLCWHRQHPQQQHQPAQPQSRQGWVPGSAWAPVTSECPMVSQASKAEHTCSTVWVWPELRCSSQLRRWRLLRAFRGCWGCSAPTEIYFCHKACEKADDDFSLHRWPCRLGECSRAL